MNMENQGVIAASSPEARSGLAASMTLLFTGFVVITGLSWESVTAMVSTWYHKSSYNHGFIIFPIAAYLAWERRWRLRELTLRPCWSGLLVVAGFALMWLISSGASILEGEQFAYIGMLQGLMLTIMGWRIFRAQLLPILYLALMVPTGAFLLPTLQTIATWLTRHLLQLTSIPFFVEQYYLQLPVGSFFIAPGCAGLNFIFSSLALSIIYAELMYAGWRRKLATVLIALGTAILANGVRIFVILWLAQVSNNRLDIVDDHILYGWGFFFIVLLLLMWVGRRFSNIEMHNGEKDAWDWLPRRSFPAGNLAAAGALSVAIAAATMGYGLAAFSGGIPESGMSLAAPDKLDGWIRNQDEMSYYPGAFGNADVREIWRYDHARASVILIAAHYSDQWQGHEADAISNRQIVGERKILRTAAPAISLNGAQHKVMEFTAAAASNNLLVWRWYCGGERFISDTMSLRVYNVLRKLGMRKSAATAYVLITEDTDSARDNMAAFLQAAGDSPGFTMMRGGEKVQINHVCW